MSVVAEYIVRPDELVLSETVTAVPDVQLEVERTYAMDPDRPILFVWVSTDEFGVFDAALNADATVESVTTLSEVDGDRLYRVAASDRVPVVCYAEWVTLGGERLTSRYDDGYWHTRIRFPDRGAVSEYRAFLESNDVDFRLEGLRDSSRRSDGELPLTERQRETLVLARERGYFEVPRSATIRDIADELGVSNQAVSERLRRGYGRLIDGLVG